MRGWIIMGVVAAGAVAGADTSGVSVPAGAVGCVDEVVAVLLPRYPGVRDDGDYSCTQFATAVRRGVACQGECYDYSCRTDACLSHDQDIYVSLMATRASTGWARTESKEQLTWSRSYGDVLAMIEVYGKPDERRAPPELVQKVRRALDRCLASR